MTTTLTLCDLPLELLQTVWASLPNRDLVTVMCVSEWLKQSVSRYDLQRRKWLASTVNELALVGDIEGVKYVWGKLALAPAPAPPANSTWAMVNACRFGHLDVVEFLCGRMSFSIHEFNVACAYGKLAVVKFLHGRRDTHKIIVRDYKDTEVDRHQNELNMYNYDLEGYEGDDTDESNAMDGAAENGQLPVVQFLHTVGMPYTIYAMDFAAGEGHLDVVQYLHGVGANCTSSAMDHASRMGFLNVVEFLLAMGKPYTVWAIDFACANGHLDILRLFYRHNGGKLEIRIGACAALNENQIGVLQFLNQVGVFKSDPTKVQELYKQTLRMDTFIKPEIKGYVHSLFFNYFYPKVNMP